MQPWGFKSPLGSFLELYKVLKFRVIGYYEGPNPDRDWGRVLLLEEFDPADIPDKQEPPRRFDSLEEIKRFAIDEMRAAESGSSSAGA